MNSTQLAAYEELMAAFHQYLWAALRPGIDAGVHCAAEARYLRALRIFNAL